MALLAAHGEIEPMPKLAIFADTGWEPKAVYEWLDTLEKLLPYPVVRVQQYHDMTIRSHTLKGTTNPKYRNGAGRTTLPFYVTKLGHDTGIALRKCTAEFKIKPIERYLRRNVLGLAKGQRAPRTPFITQWRGISTDEASRMKPSREKWMTVRYPLAMELNMSRGDCLNWMEKHGYPRPPRSACIGCPFHSDYEWRDMKLNRPDEFADAVEFDSAIRKAGGMRGETFLHRSCVPLSEVDFSTDVDRGQRLLSEWAGECEGMCGL